MSASVYRNCLLVLMTLALSGCAHGPPKCQEEIELLLWEISIQPADAKHSEVSQALRQEFQLRVRQCPEALRQGITQTWFGIIDSDVWFSPLTLAAFTNDKELVFELLGSADDWVQRIEKAKLDVAHPLHVAAFEADTDVVRALVAYGFDPNRRDVNGLRPLNHAISGLRPLENAGVLLALGGEPCPEGPVDASPLMVAALLNEIEVARALLAECKPGAVSSESLQRLIDRALERDHFELAEFFEAALAGNSDTVPP
ncbi:MAG: ankyrin repeat domain-containing protein [Gammaproteobacteria bacterium]|nr:ankyrin repeat domain-containing protein [Gammaproteobacteria bacterium]